MLKTAVSGELGSSIQQKQVQPGMYLVAGYNNIDMATSFPIYLLVEPPQDSGLKYISFYLGDNNSAVTASDQQKTNQGLTLTTDAGIKRITSLGIDENLPLIKAKLAQAVSLAKTFRYGDTGAKTISGDITNDWQTYTDTVNGFTIRFPKYLQTTPNSQASEVWVSEQGLFGPPSSAQGGYVWAIGVKKAADLEKEIASQGDQWSDRVEKRASVTVDGKSAVLVTVTTAQEPTWIHKVVYLTDDDRLITISNGAIDLAEFETFYRQFRFAN